MADFRISNLSTNYTKPRKEIKKASFSFSGLRISILGCGWLGYPLARSLILKKALVKGSTTTQSKLSLYQSTGIEGYLLNF